MSLNGHWIEKSNNRQTMMDRDLNSSHCIRYFGTCLVEEVQVDAVFSRK